MNPTDDERYLIYSIFDGLNYLFGLADYKAIEVIVNQDLFHGLASLSHLDKTEREIFEKAETSNEFYHLQSGSNRKHYKEFAYAFIGDVIKHSEASLKFLLFCSKMYTENMHKADGDKEKAAAALFILALCEKESLEAHKAHVAGFCKAELVPLILTEGASADKLVRFRAIWIVETYATFLDMEDIKKLMLYYGKILVAPDQTESELIKAASAMAVFRYMSETDTDESPLTETIIKGFFGYDVTCILRVFLKYMRLYPELLEFPNGVQNLMTLFVQDIHYDFALVKEICETFETCFNIIMAKDQFIQKMSDENEEPYVEYLQPVFMVMMSALKVGL